MTTEVVFPLAGKRIWVAGHRGMVGSALVRRLTREDCEILTVDRNTVDLRRQAETEAWMAAAKPDAVILAAARVGGIAANNAYPGEFLHDNLAIQGNVIEGARRIGVGKVLFLGSSCIYPKLAPQPIPEEALLTGPLESTNEWYAIAKIAGLKLCQAYRRQYGCDFISAMPTNLYGPGDNFDLEESHVLPALIRKTIEAKAEGRSEVVVWGSGAPKREFMHVDDCADALVHLLKVYSGESHINVGSGQEVSIAELAEIVTRVTGFNGAVVYDRLRPDGTPRKRLDVSRLTALGWSPRIELASGVAETSVWFADSRGMSER
jgi:GDP-L-fucose synthase